MGRQLWGRTKDNPIPVSVVPDVGAVFFVRIQNKSSVSRLIELNDPEDEPRLKHYMHQQTK